LKPLFFPPLFWAFLGPGRLYFLFSSAEMVIIFPSPVPLFIVFCGLPREIFRHVTSPHPLTKNMPDFMVSWLAARSFWGFFGVLFGFNPLLWTICRSLPFSASEMFFRCHGSCIFHVVVVVFFLLPWSRPRQNWYVKVARFFPFFLFPAGIF